MKLLNKKLSKSKNFSFDEVINVNGAELVNNDIDLKYEGEKVVGGKLAKDFSYGGFMFRAGEVVSFADSKYGGPTYGTLSKDDANKNKVNGIPVSGFIAFNSKTGKVFSSESAKETKINGVTAAVGSELDFNKDGKVIQIKDIVGTVELNGTKLNGGILFYPDGKIEGGYLADNYVVDDRTYMKGHRIKFTKDGKIKYGEFRIKNQAKILVDIDKNGKEILKNMSWG